MAEETRKVHFLVQTVLPLDEAEEIAKGDRHVMDGVELTVWGIEHREVALARDLVPLLVKLVESDRLQSE